MPRPRKSDPSHKRNCEFQISEQGEHGEDPARERPPVAAEKMKPCPFCGLEAIVQSCGEFSVTIGCRDVACAGYRSIDGVPPMYAYPAWNRRVESPTPSELSAKPDPRDAVVEAARHLRKIRQFENDFDAYLSALDQAVDKLAALTGRGEGRG